MTLLSVRHVTTYRYRQPVSFGEHRMMFRPRDSYDQKLLESRLQITPEPSSVRWVHDVFGNCVTIAEFAGAEADELRFESNIWLDHSPSNTPDFQIEDYAKTYPFSYGPEEMPDLAPVMVRQYPDPDGAVERWVRRFLRTGQRTDTGMLLMTLTYAFKESFTYERRSEPGTRPPALTLKLGRGSCRDLALLMIEALRCLGLRRALRLGLPVRAEPRPRRRALSRRRLDARLVPGLSAGRRLGGVRPHQCDRRQPRSDARGGGARSEPGHSAVGIVFRCGRRLPGDDGGGQGSLGASRRASPRQRPPRKRDTLSPDDLGASALPASRWHRSCLISRQATRDTAAGRERMKIRAGYEITYECPQPTPMVLLLSVHPSRMADLAAPHRITFDPPVAAREYRDDFDNICTRVVAPPGRLTIATDFVVSDPGTPDIVAPDAEQVPVQDLPDDVLIYLLGSRYCDTDHLSNMAWSMFGSGPTGWGAGAGDLRLRPPAPDASAISTPRRRAPPGTASASSAACAGISRISPSRCAAA